MQSQGMTGCRHGCRHGFRQGCRHGCPCADVGAVIMGGGGGADTRCIETEGIRMGSTHIPSGLTVNSTCNTFPSYSYVIKSSRGNNFAIGIGQINDVQCM